jgi:hypothetical protein
VARRFRSAGPPGVKPSRVHASITPWARPLRGRRFSVVEPAFKAGAHAYSLSVVHWFGL